MRLGGGFGWETRCARCANPCPHPATVALPLFSQVAVAVQLCMSVVMLSCHSCRLCIKLQVQL